MSAINLQQKHSYDLTKYSCRQFNCLKRSGDYITIVTLNYLKLCILVVETMCDCSRSVESTDHSDPAQSSEWFPKFFVP